MLIHRSARGWKLHHHHHVAAIMIAMSHHSDPVSTAPGIQLVLMPQLAEAISREDDWTGTQDAAARRRAQTRLNTRAYRKRKALAKKAEASDTSTGIPIKSESLVECWDVGEDTMSMIPASRAKKLYSAGDSLLPYKPREKNKASFQVLFPLCPDHLIALQQLNALRALAVNRTLISGVLTTPLECAVEIIHVVPYPAEGKHRLPPSLLPTILQQTVPHPDWIDLFPCPVGRDRLITAAGTYDEDDLWADCIGGLYEGFPDDEIGRRGIVAWSPPWNVSGWEMSEGFLEKWGWIVEGVPGMLEATNRWRMERGEDLLYA